MLKHQHREVEASSSRCTRRRGESRAASCSRRIADALAVHSAIEERHFYPAVNERTTEEILLESLEEHLAIKRVMADMLQLDPATRVRGQIKVLEDEVAHHVEEEEETLFPRVERMFDDEALESLGDAREGDAGSCAMRAARVAAVPSETDAPRRSRPRSGPASSVSECFSGPALAARRDGGAGAAGRPAGSARTTLISSSTSNGFRITRTAGPGFKRRGRTPSSAFPRSPSVSAHPTRSMPPTPGIVRSAITNPGGLRALQQGHRGPRSVDPVRVKTFVAQHLHDQRVQLRVVVDHQHPPGRRHALMRVPNRSSSAQL